MFFLNNQQNNEKAMNNNINRNNISNKLSKFPNFQILFS